MEDNKLCSGQWLYVQIDISELEHLGAICMHLLHPQKQAAEAFPHNME